MAVLYSKDFSDYANIAAVAADGWTISNAGTDTTLESSGGPLGTDKFMRFRDNSGGSNMTRTFTPGAGDVCRMAAWVRSAANEPGDDLDAISFAFMQLRNSSTVYAAVGIAESLRTGKQWDDATHGMGGVPKCNDGSWHHAELYVKISDTAGVIMLWLDGILIYHNHTDTSDAATTMADVNNILLTHISYENAGVLATDVAHFVVWDDDGGGLTGYIGPHRVNSDGSVTTGIPLVVTPNTDYGAELIQANLAVSGTFDITFPDMQSAGQNLLVLLGFTNAADADDTVRANASLNSFCQVMTDGGMTISAKSCDAITTGSGAARAHREGYFTNQENSGDDYVNIVNDATTVTSSVGTIEVGTNGWSSERAGLGEWSNLSGVTVTGPGLQADLLGIPNEMLDAFFRYAGNMNTDPTNITVGFEPDVIIAMSANDTSNGTGGGNFQTSLGIFANMAGGEEQRMVAFSHGSSSTAANNDFYHQIADDKIVMEINPSTGAAVYSGAISLSGGDTVALDMSTTTTDVVHLIGLKFKDGRKFHLGDISSPTVTGAQAISGLGFQPGVVLLFMFDDGTALNSIGSNAATGLAISMMTEDLQRTLNFSVDPDANPTVAKSYRSAKAMKFYDGPAAAVSLEATLDSMDADGFTLDWTTVKGSACRGFFLAIEGDGGGPGPGPGGGGPPLFIIACG